MKSLRNVLPVLCVVNLLLFMMLASHWWLGALVGVLIGAAFYLTCLPLPPTAAAEAHDAPREVGQDSGLLPLMQCVLPAWQGNVQLARAQTQAAIDNLTTRFGGIHDRLGGVLAVSQGSRNAEVLQVIQNAAQQLGSIATALDGILASRQALLGKLDGLAAGNEEIRQLALQNEQLAGQTGVTDLLSDAQSWQELAARSAENSRQIIARAKSMRQQIQVATSASAELPAGTTGIIENSRAVIDQVVADFRQSALQLSTTVEQLEAENREVDREVCEILVNLQFQDRISQILDHVQRDIQRLQEAAGRSALPAPEQWLAQLQQTYTTQEQRQLHAGTTASLSPQSQVDFF